VVFYVACFIVAFAPLLRGGNRPMPLMILECAGLLVLAATAWSHAMGGLRQLPATLWWGAGILVLAPLVQLLPLPLSWWSALPGHEPYANALAVTGSAAMRPISLHPRATEYSWLVLLPCVAIFVAIQGFDRVQVRRLVTIFLVVAVAEALLGIVQAGAAKDSIVNLGNPHGGGAATGTYINKNHFAALMAMALPLLLARWALEVLPVIRRGERLREHPRNADMRLAVRILFSILVVLLLLALLLTRSRAGIACGLVALSLTSIALVWNAGSTQAKALLIVVAAGALLLGSYVGLTPVIERFAPEEISLGYGGRAQLANATVRAALDFLPLGSGLGTFADVFRRYQHGGLPGFIDHAHNDYAEAFLELGVAAVAALLLLAMAYAARWRQLLDERRSRTLGFLQVAAGFGMLAVILHGAFDFNFHIPANAIYFSFLAGLFFFTPAEDRA
jgi:O-antigen ligase